MVHMVLYLVFRISVILIVFLQVKTMICVRKMVGLTIITCYHMEEGKVLSSMAGSQDALLPTTINTEITQTMTLTVKIMYYYGNTLVNGQWSYARSSIAARCGYQ
jgi:hypothetical protein